MQHVGSRNWTLQKMILGCHFVDDRHAKVVLETRSHSRRTGVRRRTVPLSLSSTCAQPNTGAVRLAFTSFRSFPGLSRLYQYHGTVLKMPRSSSPRIPCCAVSAALNTLMLLLCEYKILRFWDSIDFAGIIFCDFTKSS